MSPRRRTGVDPPVVPVRAQALPAKVSLAAWRALHRVSLEALVGQVVWRASRGQPPGVSSGVRRLVSAAS